MGGIKYVGLPGRDGGRRWLPAAFWAALSVPVVKHVGGTAGLPAINADHVVLLPADIVLVAGVILLLVRLYREAAGDGRLLRGKLARAFAPDLAGAALIGLAAAYGASSYYAPQPLLALVAVGDVARYYVVYALFREWGRQGLKYVAGALLAVGLAQGLLCLVQFGLQNNFGLWEKPGFGAFVPGLERFGLKDVFARGGGTFEPNVVAQFLQTTLPFALGAFLAAGSGKGRGLAASAVVLSAAALTVTFSRGGWLGAALAVAVLVAAAWLTGMGSLAARWGVTAFALTLLAPAVVVIIARGVGADDASALSRVDDWSIAAAMIRDHPLWGAGRGNYLILAPLYNPWAFAYPVHNVFLYLWAEAGLWGLASLLLLIFAALRGAARRLRQGGQDRSWAVAAGAAAVGIVARMTVSMSFIHPLASLTFLALTAAVNAPPPENETGTSTRP